VEDAGKLQFQERRRPEGSVKFKYDKWHELKRLLRWDKDRGWGRLTGGGWRGRWLTQRPNSVRFIVCRYMEIINIVMSCHYFGHNGMPYTQPPGVLISNFVNCHSACWSGAKRKYFDDLTTQRNWW